MTRRGWRRRSATCCRSRRRSTSRHITVAKVDRRRAARAPARAAARAGGSRSTRRSRNADRVTVAVTLFALLELYKQGEATWTQDEPFAEITVIAVAARSAPRAADSVSAR